MGVVLDHPEGRVEVGDPVDGLRTVRVVACRPDMFVSAPSFRTAYPPELIDRVLAVKGPAYLGDELRRDEDPSYIARALRNLLLGHFDESAFDDARLLDFGCGSGASTAVVARMLPKLRIVGVELVPEYAELARARLAYHGLTDRAAVLTSPDPARLPPDLGQFDFVIMSAVWEHMLPGERRDLLPMLWNVLRPGGALFIDQTPYRWSPVESHTTGIPLLNYLPALIAGPLARRFSRRVASNETWESLLRAGIRGGSDREIVGILRRAGAEPEVLSPTNLGFRDRIDLWYATSAAVRQPAAKRACRMALKLAHSVTGAVLTPRLSIAVSKVD